MQQEGLRGSGTAASTWSTTGRSAGGGGIGFRVWVHRPLRVATCSLTSATPRALQGTEQAARSSSSRAEAEQHVRWRTTANATSKLMSLRRRSAGKARRFLVAATRSSYLSFQFDPYTVRGQYVYHRLLGMCSKHSLCEFWLFVLFWLLVHVRADQTLDKFPASA